MNLRHEWKHEMNDADIVLLRPRLRAVMMPDKNGTDGRYQIRSLYFDNAKDKVLLEKINGVKCREKFRIRYYNGDTSRIQLEKKSRFDGLGKKQSVLLTKEEAQAAADGDWEWMRTSTKELVQEFYAKIHSQGLRPKTIVDYTREAYVYGPGNVRVTFDSDIRTGLGCTDFLNPGCITVPAGSSTAVLEVKWDAFLPDIIRDAVRLPGRRAASFSKYQVCRIYG